MDIPEIYTSLYFMRVLYWLSIADLDDVLIDIADVNGRTYKLNAHLLIEGSLRG